jgi:hypothetical protein
MDFSPAPFPLSPSPPPRSAHRGGPTPSFSPRARTPSRARARRGPPQLPAAAQRAAPPSLARASPSRQPLPPPSRAHASGPASASPARAREQTSQSAPQPSSTRELAQQPLQACSLARTCPCAHDRAWRTPAAAATTQPGARASGALLFIFLEPPHTISFARRPVFSPRTPAIPYAVLAHRCFASPIRRRSLASPPLSASPSPECRVPSPESCFVEVSSPPSSLPHSSLDVLLVRHG